MLGQNWRSSSYHLQAVLPPCLLGASTGWGETANEGPRTSTPKSSVLAERCCWSVLIHDAGATHNSSEAPVSIITGCECPELIMAAALKAGPGGP